MPKGTIDIGDEAFSGCEKLQSVEIPATIGHIGENAFAGCPNVTIRCDKDSIAHDYAVANNIPFVLK